MNRVKSIILFAALLFISTSIGILIIHLSNEPARICESQNWSGNISYKYTPITKITYINCSDNETQYIEKAALLIEDYLLFGSKYRTEKRRC